MAESEPKTRDETGEWLLPAPARPLTVSELEARIETALAIARASERAALAIGDAAIEAAEQARRAAGLAEQAAARAAAVSVGAAMPVAGGVTDPGEHRFQAPTKFDERVRVFGERASRVSIRLIALGASPAAVGDREALPAAAG